MKALLRHLRLGQDMKRPNRSTAKDFVIAAAAKSVQGSHCVANEDCFRLDERRGVFVIADGLGGHCGGERASRLAAAGLMHEADFLLAQRRPEDSLAGAMAQAFSNVNQSILSVRECLPRLRRMGASAVMAIANFGRLYVVGVGDCRVYLVRGEQAERMTVDQTLVQLDVDAGLGKAPSQTARSERVLWTYLGDPKFEPPRIRCAELRPSDRLILVTNGITRVVRDGLIGRLDATNENAVGTATNVVSDALALGTTDDATCVAASFAAASSGSV